MATRERIVILGGGVGAVAAAFALTEGDNLDRYDVTIYQVGWRLGGKGASSRNPDALKAHRIEEHGLHIWFGFYANALAMMERCYDELGDPNDTFAKAFTNHSRVVLEDFHNGRWVPFPLQFPEGDDGESADAGDLLKALLKWLENDVRARLGNILDVFDPFGKVPSLFDFLQLGAPKGLDDLFTGIQRTRDHMRKNASIFDNQRWAWMAWDIGWAIVHGMLKHDVVRKGFHTIDKYDLWDWLRDNGAEDYHELSVMVRGLYTQAFAFQNGHEKTRRMAAGASLRSALRMTLGYKGAFMRKMNAGMGDIVFAPFYRVLKKRGVRFKFFHRVRQLHLASNDPTMIDKITLGRQVTLQKTSPVDPSAPPSCCPDEPEYQPLVTVPDPRVGVRHCWHLEPDHAQIDGADAAKMQQMKADPKRYFNLESVWTSWDKSHEKDCVLERGKHFDHVVLAISVGALRPICKELAAQSDDWKKMLKTTATVRTQAAQLWLEPDLKGLGWTTEEPVHGAYAFPMDSWASMSQTIAAEPWPKRPGSIAYFCGVLPHDEDDPPWFSDPDFPKRQHAKVRETMKKHLRENIGHMWPNAVGANGFRWDMLIDLANGTGEQRLDAQHIIANVDPTERYVLSVPESMEHRLPSGASGFTNLVLAGDWTRNAVNLGCVEAAVSSGMAASRGISGHPKTIVADSDP